MMYITIVVKLIVAMFGILFFLRLSGKTQMSQVTPITIVNGFVLGALIGGVVYTPSLSVVLLIYAMIIWSLVNYAVNYLSRFNLFKKLVYGKHEYIIRDGVLNFDILKRNNLNIEQLRTMLREKDIFSLMDVDNVVFETDGQLSISRKKEIPEAYLFISNGEIEEDALKDAKKTKKWLTEELEKLNVKKPEDLYCVEYTAGHGFYIVDKEGSIKVFNENNRLKKSVKKD